MVPHARPMVTDTGIVPSKSAPDRPAAHHVVLARTIKFRYVEYPAEPAGQVLTNPGLIPGTIAADHARRGLP